MEPSAESRRGPACAAVVPNHAAPAPEFAARFRQDGAAGPRIAQSPAPLAPSSPVAAAAAALAGARNGHSRPAGALRRSLHLRWGLAGLRWARAGSAASGLACLDAEPVSAAFSVLPARRALSLGAGAAGVLLPEGYAGSVVCA